MAGSNTAFDAATFRTNIKNTMRMGLPNNTSDQATFRWVDEKTYVIAGPHNNPYDWGETPLTTVHKADVQVDVAVQLLNHTEEYTSVGELDNQKIQVTLLDVDYALVSDADLILLDGKTFEINFWTPSIGLFDVTVHQAFATAIDES